mmetsp:Transcript_95177/g.254447  ORF Transcript_95177/g.254447 Transcript_95177/m.254447 type:complete len:122 (-) Transcript_95177:326-691(-)
MTLSWRREKCSPYGCFRLSCVAPCDAARMLTHARSSSVRCLSIADRAIRDRAFGDAPDATSRSGMCGSSQGFIWIAHGAVRGTKYAARDCTPLHCVVAVAVRHVATPDCSVELVSHAHRTL